MKTLLWTFLLALQSNRGAEFSILHSPALIPKFPQSPSSSYLFSHGKSGYEVFIGNRKIYEFQSPSGSYLFSHGEAREEVPINNGPQTVSIALKLLPVFTQSISIEVSYLLDYLQCFNRPQALICFHTLKKIPKINKDNSRIYSFNRPQALTCFHTAAVFNTENLRLFKPQNTNLSF